MELSASNVVDENAAMDGVVTALPDQNDTETMSVSIDEKSGLPRLPPPSTTANTTGDPGSKSEGAASAANQEDVIDLTDDTEPSSASLTTPIKPQENTATKRKRVNDDHDVTAPASKKITTPSSATITKPAAKAAAPKTTKVAAKPTNKALVTPNKVKTVAETPAKSLVASAVAATPSTPTTVPQQRTSSNPALSTPTP
ncbi:hypothetical protein LTR95_019551, partial [Oleoguttula sp. CCFEE 5521]